MIVHEGPLARIVGVGWGAEDIPLGELMSFRASSNWDWLTPPNMLLTGRVNFTADLDLAADALIGVAELTVFANGGTWWTLPCTSIGATGGFTRNSLLFRVEYPEVNRDDFPDPFNGGEGFSGSHGIGGANVGDPGWTLTQSNLMLGSPGSWEYDPFGVSAQVRTLTKT